MIDAYTDSECAGQPDRQSISSWCVRVGGAVVFTVGTYSKVVCNQQCDGIRILQTKTQVLLDTVKTHWRKRCGPRTRPARKPRPIWRCRLATETTASAAVSGAVREVGVRLRDRPDSVNDLEPATHRQRYELNSSDSEHTGPT